MGNLHFAAHLLLQGRPFDGALSVSVCRHILFVCPDWTVDYSVVRVRFFLNQQKISCVKYAFVLERQTVDGHLDSLPLLRWILEVDLDYAYADVSWRTGTHLIDCMDIIDLLQSQGRHKQIKKAGQIGECIHDNSGTETTRRGGRRIKAFIVTYNDVYEEILDSLDPEIRYRGSMKTGESPTSQGQQRPSVTSLSSLHSIL